MDESSGEDALDPSSVSFADAYERLQGPVLGPVVVPNPSADLPDEIDRNAFESKEEVRQWAHESGLDLDEVRAGIAKPFVTVETIDDGWIAVVYVINEE